MTIWASIFVLGVLAPASAAMVVLLAAAPWRRVQTQETDRRRVLFSLAGVFTAYATGHVAFVGAPQLLPLDITHWLLHIALVALLSSVGLVWFRSHRVGSWLLRGGAALAATGIVIRPLLAHRFADSGVLAIVIGTAMLLGFVVVTEQAVSRATPRLATSLLLLIVGSSAIASAASGSVIFAQLGGAAAAGVGAIWIVALRYPHGPTPINLAPLVAIFSGAVAMLAHLYAAMPPPVLIALAAVPAMFLLVAVGASRFRWRPRGPAIALVCSLLVASAAIGIAITPDDDDSEQVD